jgi:hypothetical protein
MGGANWPPQLLQKSALGGFTLPQRGQHIPFMAYSLALCFVSTWLSNSRWPGVRVRFLPWHRLPFALGL